MKSGEDSLSDSPSIVGAMVSGNVETLSAGAELGNYRIIRFLGAGGMGAVYLAEHIHLSTRHALKTIRPEVARLKEFKERFLREAKLMARLKHPHIVSCSDAGVVQDTPYLVMDYIEGPGGEPMNLRELLDQRKARGQLMDEAEAVAVGLDICRALEYAHNFRDAGIPNGIIHRDLKPANILLDQETHLYITDFGLARLIGENFEASVVQAHALSMSLGSAPTMRKGQASTSSDTVGTFDYMSPEQRDGRVADARSDVYALGAILYELLTGRKVVGVPTPPSVVRPGLAPIWDDIILEHALAYEPEERYASAGELCRAIEQAYFHRAEAKPAAAVPPPVASPPPAPAPAVAEKPANVAAPIAVPRPKKNKKLWVAGGVVVTAAVAGLLIWAPWSAKGSKTRSKSSAVRTANTPARSATTNTTARTTTPSRPSMTQPAVPVVNTRSKEKPEATTTALAALQNAPTAFTNGLGMKFVPVPGTEVLFSIWDTRVQDYAEFVRETGQAWEKPEFAQGPTHPVVKVNWNDATAFCVWLTAKERRDGRIRPQQGYRLPQDWEWSVAVGLNEQKGGTPSEKHAKIEIYPWDWGRGRLPAPVGAGNYEASEKVDSFANTSPVGSFVPNQFGLFDMGGNVRQWCEDFFDGRSGAHVLRGGTWSDESDTIDDLVSSQRNSNSASVREEDVGFRVVMYSSVLGGLGNLLTWKPTAAVASAGQPRPGLGAPYENGLGMKFVPVAGTKVLFSIWDTRVQDYKVFLEATGHSAVKTDFAQGPTHPAVYVSWYDANNFCQWLTKKEQDEGRLGPDQFYRLPKDWEWSTAACLPEVKRGTPSDKDREIDNVYPWGNGEGTWPPPSGAGNYAPAIGVDIFEKTSAVGSFAANPHGLFDMGGNVWQWCEDLFDTDNDYRALRGGSWASGRTHMLSSCRDDGEAEARHGDYGFRCVLEVGGNQTVALPVVVSQPPGFVSAPNDHPELDTGLIAHYLLNGNARDSSPNALHGINEGATAAPDYRGRTDGAMSFDGKAQIRVPHDKRLNFVTGDKYTVTCWAKRMGGADPQHLLGKRGQGDGWWQLAWGSPWTHANLQSGTLPIGRWSHIAEIGDCRQTTCITHTYVDGKSYISDHRDGFPAGPNTAEFIIGGSARFAKFTGMICDVRIYNRALSAVEIATLAGQPAGPIANDATQGGPPRMSTATGNQPLEITKARFTKGMVYGAQWDVGACLARKGGTGRISRLSSSVFPADGYVSFSYNNMDPANPFTMTIYNADGSVNGEAIKQGKFVAVGEGKCMFVGNDDWTGFLITATPLAEGSSIDWPHTGFATPADYPRIAAMGRVGVSKRDTPAPVSALTAPDPSGITNAKFFKGTIFHAQWDVGACLARTGNVMGHISRLDDPDFPAGGYIGFTYNKLDPANPFTIAMYNADGSVKSEFHKKGKFVAMGDGKCMFVADNDWDGFFITAVPMPAGKGVDWPHRGFATPADYPRIAAMGRNAPASPTGTPTASVAGASAAVIFQDNFDSAPAGKFPAGWELRYNGAGNQQQSVDRARCVSVPHALHLVGSGSWSANAYHPLDLSVSSTPRVILTAKVFVEQIVPGGVSPIIASVALENPQAGSWGTPYGTVQFQADGNIYAVPEFSGSANVKLMKYQEKTWYTIKTDIDLVRRVFDVYVNGTLKASSLKLLEQGSPTGVEVVAGHGNGPTVWFDDVVVSKGPGR